MLAMWLTRIFTESFFARQGTISPQSESHLAIPAVARNFISLHLTIEDDSMDILTVRIFAAVSLVGCLAAIAPPTIAQTAPTKAMIGIKDIARVNKPAITPALKPKSSSIEQFFAPEQPVAEQVSAAAAGILSARQQLPERINPIDILKNPSVNFDRFWNQQPLQPAPEKPLVFTIPALDSSVKLQVLSFQ
jgi:hypothetical protein